MIIERLEGSVFAKMVLMGANHLTNHAKQIDALNVFPVPDGDTGTNMNLSMTSGANEVKQTDDAVLGDVAQAFSKGLLMGARGNSGVILSQLFRGFAKSLEHKEAAAPEELAEAFENGVKTAYKAVMKPVEGTILTVAKDAANKAVEVAKHEKDIAALMDAVLKEAKESLKRTPELLSVLKEVGVVDSGGQGLVTIYEGFAAALKGKELPEADVVNDMEELVNAQHHQIAQDFMDTSEIEFGYCTEFMVKFDDQKLKDHPFDEEQFRNELSEHGNSLLVAADDEIAKVHIHVEYPGQVLTIGQQYGSLINMKIENMREQHTAIVGKKEEKQQQPQKKQPYGIVTVVMGQGVKSLFESLGATVVIEGGQTMNPSTQDIADAIQQANAEKVLILPNNKNIVMAAQQAAELADAEAAVVETKTIPQGISALLAFHPELALADNKQEMEQAGQQVKTGQVTYAVRDTKIDGVSIEKGHFMGIEDGKITSANPDKLETVEKLLQSMVTDEDEILTIIYGEDVDKQEVEKLQSYVEKHFEDIELEIHEGNQPIYAYIIAVE
ncbi:DAK2 domain-containing protein [Virgibacillus halophilus]|uniref:DAK2 domain-containing protein n=1 Tax=Tigheibacillus halophilus TaxID=361280 RepID=UPI003638EAE2